VKTRIHFSTHPISWPFSIATAGGPLQAFPSRADWRDRWIYFLMVDRFNNSQAPPRHQPYNDPNYYDFQGGNLV
jgi:hypothetical protein